MPYIRLPGNVMTLEMLFVMLDGLRMFTAIKRVKAIQSIIYEFVNNIENFRGDKMLAISRLKKVIYHTRMTLAFNRATESNTGDLDQELEALSAQLDLLTE